MSHEPENGRRKRSQGSVMATSMAIGAGFGVALGAGIGAALANQPSGSSK